MPGALLPSEGSSSAMILSLRAGTASCWRLPSQGPHTQQGLPCCTKAEDRWCRGGPGRPVRPVQPERGVSRALWLLCSWHLLQSCSWQASLAHVLIIIALVWQLQSCACLLEVAGMQ